MLWIGLLAGAEAQLLHTAFLGPSAVGGWGQNQSYYYGVSSADRKLCHTGWLCQYQPSLSNQMQKIYTDCGFSHFLDYNPPYYLTSLLTRLPHQVPFSIYLTAAAPPTLANCLYRLSGLSCIPSADQAAIAALQNQTAVKVKGDFCLPNWVLAILITLLCLLISALTLIILKALKRRGKRYLTQADIAGEEISDDEF